MIVSKTPLRISLFGGGSDIPSFYEKQDGICLSTTIDQYVSIAVNTTSNQHVKLTYSQIEVERFANKLKHNRAKAVLEYFDVHDHIEIASFADIPTKGTGLGSSSTFTVGLINAIAHYTGKTVSRYDLAELASEIEIVRCGEPIGKQDQYAAAYGGMNIMWFNKESTRVIPVPLSSADLIEFNDNLMCYNTGITRNASSVLDEQVKRLKTNSNLNETRQIVEIASRAVDLLLKKKFDAVGQLLNDTWETKKKLSSGISNEVIDEMYDIGMKAGALGGKLLGAGGGGYMLFYVPKRNQNKVASAMSKYQRFNFKFTDSGSQIVVG